MGLAAARFSPDGRWLHRAERGALTAVNLESGEKRVLWDPAQHPAPCQDLVPFIGGAAACLYDSRHVLFNVGRRDFSLQDGPVNWEIWEASLQSQDPPQKVLDGRIVGSSLDGRSVLIDVRPAATVAGRKAAKQPEVEGGEVKLFNVSALGN